MNPHEKITVYTPETGLKKPEILFGEMLSDIRKSWGLGVKFFQRDIKAMFRQSILGLLWAFIPPILTTSVWVFLNGQKIINIDTPTVPYPAFVLTSTLLWSVFTQALTLPNSSLNKGKDILKKINFPKEALLITGLLNIAFDFAIKIALIIVVFIIFQVTPAATVILSPIGLLMLILLGFSIGLLLLPFGMLYKDVEKTLQAILPFWMLLTPVIYPAPREGIATVLNQFNPVSPLLNVTRDWLFDGNTDFLIPFLWISLVVLGLTFLGLILFRLAMPLIIERIGN